jgi:cytochrome c-type biogenesis protein CcmH
MKNSKFRPSMCFVGTIAITVAVGLAGCQQKSEPAAATPSGNAAPASANPVPAPAADQSIPTIASLKVTVSLSPTMAKQAGPNDTVFIFARAADGPRVPLAIVRKQVKDLPATVVLDDSSAMSPTMRLSSVSEVIVVARVSKSGEAMPKAGDLEGTSAPVKVSAGVVAISIANVVAGR